MGVRRVAFLVPLRLPLSADDLLASVLVFLSGLLLGDPVSLEALEARLQCLAPLLRALRCARLRRLELLAPARVAALLAQLLAELLAVQFLQPKFQVIKHVILSSKL